MTGKQEFLGGAPSKHTIWLADYWGGMMGAVQILAALYWRDKISGEGTFTEYSQVHGVTRQLEYALPLYGRHGITRERWGNWDTQLCVHGIIKCGKSSYPKSENPQESEEGYILVSAYEDKDFARLCQAVGDGNLAGKYGKHDARVKAKSQMEIYPWLEKGASDKTKEPVAAILDKAATNNQPVWNSKEGANHPHCLERDAVQWLDDPTYGDLLHQGPAHKMSETPPPLKWALQPVGADNEHILGNLAGLSSEDLRRLEEQEGI